MKALRVTAGHILRPVGITKSDCNRTFIITYPRALLAWLSAVILLLETALNSRIFGRKQGDPAAAPRFPQIRNFDDAEIWHKG